MDIVENTTITNWTMDESTSPTESSGMFPSFMIWDVTFTQRDINSFKILCEVLMSVTMAAIILAMGSILNYDEIKKHFKSPTTVIVASLSQFFFYPAVVFGFCLVINLSHPYTVGMVLTAISPTSPIACLLTFFLDGNICISVSLTALSTIAGLVIIPSVLSLFSDAFYADAIIVPAYSLSLALFTFVFPLCIGILCRYLLKPSWNRIVIILGLSFGLAGFTANIAIQFYLNKTLLIAPINVYIALAFLPVLSYTMGYVIGFLLRQDSPTRKALAICMVYHNMAVSILSLSTPVADIEGWKEFSTFPALHSPVAGIYGFFGILLYLICFPRDRDSGFTSSQVLLTDYRMLHEEEFPEPNGNDTMVNEENDDLKKMGLVGRGGEIVRIDSITMPTVTKEYTS